MTLSTSTKRSTVTAGLIVLLALSLAISPALADTTPILAPTGNSDSSAIGTTIWENTWRIMIRDGQISRAWGIPNNEVSHYLVGTFTPNLPPNTTIQQIDATIYKFSSSPGGGTNCNSLLEDNLVSLWSSDGSAIANSGKANGTWVITTPTASTYSWTDFSNIDLSTFNGVAISARNPNTASGCILTGYVDYMSVVITYAYNTTTTVSCTPDNLTVGGASTCTATVTLVGGSDTLVGKEVSWSTNGSGVFGGAGVTNNKCTLAGTAGNASCSATYTPGSIGTGTHSVAAVFAGTTSVSNRLAPSSGFQNVSVSKGDPTCTIIPYHVTYDGNPHTATGSCLGINGEPLPSPILSGTTHTNAGDYPSDTWSFTATDDYNAASGTVHNSIAKADATIVVTPYSTTYTGDPHTATGSATGVKGESLSGLVLSGTNHTDAGDYTSDAWTFIDGTGNYKNASGTVHNSIAKADATCVVTGYAGVYNGQAHGATGTCTGVKDEILTGLDLGSSFTNVPGGTADWIFTDAAGNYNIHSSTATISITARSVSVTPSSGQHKIYGAADPAFPFNVTSGSLVAGDQFSGALSRVSGSAVGSYEINKGSLALTSNYDLSVVTGVMFSIDHRPITVTADARTKTYGDTDPALTYQVTQGSLVAGDSITGDLVRDDGENVGVYAINRGTLAVNDNYTLTFAGGDLTITPATLTITADDLSKRYGEDIPMLTYTVSGLKNDDKENDLGGVPELTTDATKTCHGGTYAIVVTVGGLESSNYVFEFVNGKLAVLEFVLNLPMIRTK